ncbi:hypothetical protein [Sporosarcina sp. P37]|nr:hypothetical protein [Sporosarcina sp. P37]
MKDRQPADFTAIMILDNQKGNTISFGILQEVKKRDGLHTFFVYWE